MQPRGLVDAATLARLLSVSRSSVYEHKVELGGVEVCGRLRFDPERALETWTCRGLSERSQPPEAPAPVEGPRRRRRAAARTGDGLLPVEGRVP